MEEDSPTLSKIVHEVCKDGYFKRAQQRASRRKSPWNLILIPLIFGSAGLITYAFLQMMWFIHVIIYPAHADKFGEFWSKGIGFSSFISSFLLFVPLLFASLTISLLFTNVIIWLIPPARRALDREAEGIKWASFPEATSSLWSVAKIVVPVSLLLSLIGAITLSSLS